MIDKFPEEQRTFETRLLFIKSIFSGVYSKDQILTSCIQHKLGRSFEQYVQTMNSSTTYLKAKDPLQVLKKI